MEKTKLMLEAIEAFKLRYGELPADAGYPVIKEEKSRVYFFRSQKDWEKYRYANNHIVKFITIMVILLVGGIIGTLIAFACGVGCTSTLWFLAAMLAAYILVYILFRNMDKISFIEYDGVRETLYAIN